MTLDEILAEVRAEVTAGGQLNLRALRDRLLDREDNIADFIRLAGAQFGLFPGIVSKVLQDSGLGTPPTAEVRALVDQQYVETIEEIRRQQGE